MQEEEDLELRERGRTWDGELSESDSEDHDLPRRHQGVIASEAAFARSVPLHLCFSFYIELFGADHKWWNINSVIL